MACSIGLNSAEDLVSDECQVANKIQHFVAYKFIIETKRSVLHAIASKNDCVLFGGTANEAHVLQHRCFVKEAKGTGCRDLSNIGAISKFKLEALVSDQGCGKLML